MRDHGSIQFSTWRLWQQRRSQGRSPGELSLGAAWISVRKSLTHKTQSGLCNSTQASWAQILTRPCFLSLGFPALPPWNCSCTLAGNSPGDLRVTDPLWWWASTGTGSRLSLFIEFHSCGNWILAGCQNWGAGLQCKQKGRQHKYRWTTSGPLNISSPSCPDLRSTLYFNESS